MKGKENMQKKLLLISFILFIICLLPSCKKAASLKYDLESDEQVVNPYEGKIKVGDNLKNLLENATATKTGYHFLGWSLDGQNLISDNQKVENQEVIVKPLFEKATYTITYKINDKVWMEQSYKYEETISKPNDPVLDDYDFVNWDMEIPDIMPAKNLVVNAILNEKIYTVTFIIDENTQFIQKYNYQDEIVPPTDFAKEGYTFTSWDHDVPETMPKENLTFRAVFSANTYTITYVVEGVEEDVTYHYGDPINKKQSPEKVGHTFIGWDALEPDTMPAHNLRLVAQFRINSYTITYIVDGTEEKVTYEYGQKIVKPSSPVKVGYTFTGWSVTIPDTMPDHNITARAQFSIKSYQVTFKIEGKPDIVLTVPYNSEIKAPDRPLKDGYRFVGWDQPIPSKMPAEDLVFNALFEEFLTAQDASGSKVLFIGHAGSALGIMNTEEAFLNAVKVKGYNALECDLKQTKDGVFVLCHDDTFGGLDLASTNWANLKDVEITQTRNNVSYKTKICTLERYLEICQEYGVYPVIELKWSNGINNNDTSRMAALMQQIANQNMLDKVIFLGSQYKCLEWVRNNGYDYIPCQYLVNSADSESVLNRCIEWNFDVSFNISSTNTKEWIDRYHEAGINVACYTFSVYQSASDLQKWLDMEVDFVTCDALTRDDVNVPVRPDDSKLPTYTVTFTDGNGNTIKQSKVKQGRNAVSPVEPERLGYHFTGWDGNYQNVQSDLTINALWEIDEYNIIYDANLSTIDIVKWNSKAEFIDEFYTDWFNWLAANVGKINGLTKSGDTYTLITNPSNAKAKAQWTDVESLKALDIYVVELTIGTLVYQPIKGENSKDYIPVVADGYFLNTEPYRTKYIELNAYFLNVMEKAYTGYSRTYNQNGGKVQIFFRFHQWQQGTSIPTFDTLPNKHNINEVVDPSVVLPTTHSKYTVEDEFTLEAATRDGYTFEGWYKDQACSEKIEKITKGMTGQLVLYAKWVKNE